MDEGEAVARAVAQAWLAADGESPAGAAELAPALLTALREHELAPAEERDVLGDAVLSVLSVAPPFHERVLEELNQLLLTSEWAGKRPFPSGRPEHGRRVTVEVAYATDRESLDQHGYYGGRRGNLDYGAIGVSLPDDARMCRTAKSRPWRFGFGQDRAAQLERLATRPTSLTDFAAQLRRQVTQALSPELLVFVHGYNMTFDDAVLRTAQLAYDLDFEGVPLVFSWPSKGSAHHYIADAASTDWAQHDFRTVLEVALGASGAERVHLVAHSMGNRLLVEWLVSPEARAAVDRGPGRLGQVVFAAPNVDAGKFARDVPRFAGPAQRFTLYASSRDQALNVARTLANGPRAGQAGRGVVVASGVDTIDVSALDTGLMSHSYVGDHRSVVSDLYYLLELEHAPERRFGLRLVSGHDGPYWEFRA